MSIVLVSFIGNGNLSGGEYFSTDYYFEGETTARTTKIFGSVLLQHLVDNGKKVDSWLIMGTKESIWFDLIDIVQNPNLTAEETELQTLLFDNAYHSKTDESQIKPEQLTDWQGVLNSRLTNTEIICRLVGHASTAKSQELIFNSLDKEINKGDEIVFDVTHGLRSQPIITTFILMYLRYSKEIKIENIRFYYASLDSTKKIGTVHNLDFCNELMKATEAVAIYEQTGNYEQIGEQVNLGVDFNTKIKKLTFADEMHRASSELPNELKKQLEKTNFDKPIEHSLSTKLIKSLDWSDDLSFAKRLCKKAVSNKNKRQYFKAIASLYEAVAIASCLIVMKRDDGKQLDINDYNDRNYAINSNNGIKWKLDKSQEEKLNNLQKLRNTVLHGTEKTIPNIMNSIKDEQGFLQIFEKGLEVFEDIVNGRIKS